MSQGRGPLFLPGSFTCQRLRSVFLSGGLLESADGCEHRRRGGGGGPGALRELSQPRRPGCREGKGRAGPCQQQRAAAGSVHSGSFLALRLGAPVGWAWFCGWARDPAFLSDPWWCRCGRPWAHDVLCFKGKVAVGSLVMGSNPVRPPAPQRDQCAEQVQASRLGLSPSSDAAWRGYVQAPSDPGARGQLPSICHHDPSRREAGPLPERKLSGGSSGLGHGGLCSAQQARPDWGWAGEPREACLCPRVLRNFQKAVCSPLEP